VIATLLRNKDQKSQQTFTIKKQLLTDLIALCGGSRDNRRTILQMSVWQEFLVGLAYCYPQDTREVEITDLVYDLFRILLHHAVKFEYGGWRVWIDTLSILHSKVSREEYHNKMAKLYEDYEKVEIPAPAKTAATDSEKQPDQRTPFQPPPFRIPEFKWSHMHKRLLSDMLMSIENEVSDWKAIDGQVKTLLECANSPDNVIFCINTIHIVSQLADILTNACGGLLPLLASATTASSNEIEILENTEGMSGKEGFEFLQRIMLISDVIILGCNTSFADLEQEKNLPNGAIVRQSLRLTFTYAVRSCLESKRRQQVSAGSSSSEVSAHLKAMSAKEPVEALLETQMKASAQRVVAIKDCLLQEVDLYRLRALVYRDVVRNERNKAKPFVVVEDVKQSQYVSLATVYFISVLMVSRYRDIIESNTSGTGGVPESNTSVGQKESDEAKKFGSEDEVSLNGNGPFCDVDFNSEVFKWV